MPRRFSLFQFVSPNVFTNNMVEHVYESHNDICCVSKQQSKETSVDSMYQQQKIALRFTDSTLAVSSTQFYAGLMCMTKHHLINT